MREHERARARMCMRMCMCMCTQALDEDQSGYIEPGEFGRFMKASQLSSRYLVCYRPLRGAKAGYSAQPRLVEAAGGHAHAHPE